jgi:hypothetical protein
MKQKYFFILLLFLANSMVAQTSKSQLPPSFKYEDAIVTDPAFFQFEFKEDVEKLMHEDLENIKQGMPLRIAVGKEVSIDLSRKNTTKTVLPSNESIWQYAVRSERAKGLIITFDELYIPEGDALFAYTKDKEQVDVFTYATNPSGGIYATNALHGNEIIFEYVSTEKTGEQARIKIANIAYMYKSLTEITANLSCYIGTNCSEADNWQLQKKGVVCLMIPSTLGWGICSGSLINNVREDGEPYILTANHCVSGSANQVFPTVKFEFFKEATDNSNCFVQTEYSPYTKTLTGATLIATNPVSGGSDGTLLKINEPIPDDWDIYYNGWDAREEAVTSGVGIHHPNGYVKKISTFTAPLTSDTWIQDGGVANGHWKVFWAPTENGQSVTYGGSSGSPIFNENGLIVGTLTGGGSFCNTPNAPDYYGKFSYHWDKHTNPQKHFKNYLDPDNTGTLVLEGYDPHEILLEGSPEALEATEITPVGFTAHWTALANADKYYLSVYQKQEENIVEFVEGWENKLVGDTLSYAITGLDHETEYYYTVKAGYRSQITESSNEINVTTEPPTFEYFYPVATEATQISYDSFVANWESLLEADTYLLNVYQKFEATDTTAVVDFTDRKIPEGWTKKSISYYSQDDQVGKAAPALKLGNDDYIESPEYYEAVKSIEFWYRGITAASSNALVVSGYVDEEWIEIKRITSLVNQEGGDAIIIPFEEIPENCTAVKIHHERVAGYVSIDDIVIGYGTFPYTEYVREFNRYDIESNSISYTVENLQDSTEYYYSVVGFNGEKYSNTSNEIRVKTSVREEVALNPSAVNKTGLYADKEYIYIHTDVSDNFNVLIYDAIGNLILSSPLQQNGTLIPRKGFLPGIYFVKIGTQTHKLLLK